VAGPAAELAALLKLRGGAVNELAVVGDTSSDIESGLRAGAAIVAGVLTGASTRGDLEKAGAPLILDTIADILPHITRLAAAGDEHGLELEELQPTVNSRLPTTAALAVMACLARKIPSQTTVP
jgi:beta-phosphoglucomutase-like phosphatase (HAD superfamily)